MAVGFGILLRRCGNMDDDAGEMCIRDRVNVPVSSVTKVLCWVV